MSIFSAIKDKIFGRKAEAANPDTPAAAPPTAAPADSTGTEGNWYSSTGAISEVDVEASLSELAAGKDLNWRTSIVDLMKLVGIDSSLDNRKELAKELGYTGALDGSAEMNIWLHKATMRQLAANGGKVPADLLD